MKNTKKKKIFAVILIVFLLIFPLSCFANGSGGSGGNSQGSGGGNEPDLTPLKNQVNAIGTIIPPLAIVMLIIAGYIYISSTGNPEQLGMAKEIATGAIVGLIIYLLKDVIINSIG